MMFREIEYQISKSHLVILFSSNNLSSIGIYLLSEKCKVPIIIISDDTPLESKSELISSYRPSLIISFNRINLGYSNGTEFSFDTIGEKFYVYNRDERLLVYRDLMLLLSTSGSTGSPKLVKLSRRNVYSNSYSILGYLPIAQEDVCLLNLPISYSYGISILNTHLLSDSTIYLSNDSLMSKELWSMISTLKVNSLAGVPEMIRMLKLMKLEKRVGILENLKYVTQAGGKLDIGHRAYFNELFTKNLIEFYVMYGQTEATARMSFLGPERFNEKIASVGKPILGGNFDIQGKEKNVEGFIEGEIIYRGPNVMLGYASSHLDLRHGDDLGGILHTGDIGYLDEEGYLFITGRKKRIVKVSGKRISLDHIETKLSSLAIDNAVTNNGEKILVFITDTSEQGRVKRELNCLDIGNSNFKIFQVEKIPLNSNGKVDYLELSRNFNE